MKPDIDNKCTKGHKMTEFKATGNKLLNKLAANLKVKVEKNKEDKICIACKEIISEN